MAKPQSESKSETTLSAANEAFSNTIAVTNSNLSRLSKTVTATASSLVSSSYGDLSGTHYHMAMTDIARRPAFQKRMFSFATRKAPSEVVRSTLSVNEVRYQAVTQIPDELLHNIPDSHAKYSLFQGFQATASSAPKKTHSHHRSKSDGATAGHHRHIKDTGGSSAANDEQHNENGLEGTETTNSYEGMSVPKLAKERDSITHKLYLLEVRKDLAASEIKEIDQRIAHLQSMREIVFDRVAKLEREEFHLESDLQKIEAHLDLIDEELDDLQIDPSSASSYVSVTPTPELQSPQDNPNQLNGISEEENVDDANEDADGFLSQSIYGKLQSASPEKPENNLSSKKSRFKRQSMARRKTMPTLQQFYTPGKNIRTIMAHSDEITALDFDIPFGTLVSASLDDTVKVWDLSRGSLTCELHGHNASVKCLQVEDNLLATGSMDATARLWDLTKATNEDEEEASCVGVFQAHIGEITALHFQGNTLVTGSADKTIRQWDLPTGRCLQTLDVLWAAAQSVSNPFADDTRWRQKSASKTQRAADFVGALQCFDAALATGTADGIIRLWDLRSGQVHRSLVGHTGPVTCLQFDDVHLATGSLDRSIRIWDLRTGTIFDAFAYENPITSLHFDARRIVSTNMENTVKIYDRETERHWSCGAGADNTDAAIVQDAKCREGYLVEGRTDGKIGVWAC